MKSTINIKYWLRVGIISVSILGSYTNLVYLIGQHKQAERTGIELKEFFSFQTKKLNYSEINTTDQSIELKNIYLVKFPDDSLPNNMNVYKVHQITDDPSTIRIVGRIDTNQRKVNFLEKFKDLFDNAKDPLPDLFSELTIIKKAHAQSKFNWNGYENNRNFSERYIDEYTVRRYYQDGAILEYKISSQGVSIPTSFKWIKRAIN